MNSLVPRQDLIGVCLFLYWFQRQCLQNPLLLVRSPLCNFSFMVPAFVWLEAGMSTSIGLACSILLIVCSISASTSCFSESTSLKLSKLYGSWSDIYNFRTFYSMSCEYSTSLPLDTRWCEIMSAADLLYVGYSHARASGWLMQGLRNSLAGLGAGPRFLFGPSSQV